MTGTSDLRAPGLVSVWVGTFADDAEYREHVADADAGAGAGAGAGADSEFARAAGLGGHHTHTTEGFVSDGPLAERLASASAAASFAEAARADLSALRAHGWKPNTAHLVYDLDARPLGVRPAALALLGVYPYRS